MRFATSSASAASGSVNSFPNVYDVRAYGSIGTLNDVPAYQAAIDAMPATGGILPIVGDRPNFETTLVINKPVNFLGAGRTDSSGRFGSTIINTSSATNTPIKVTSSAVTLEKFGVNCTNHNVTAGAGILVDIYQLRSPENGWDVLNGYPQFAGGSFDINKVTVFGFYDGIHVANGIEYTLDKFHIEASRRYGLFLEHQRLEDGGDQSIMAGNIICNRYDASTACYAKSGGGIKITNLKINGRTQQFTHAIGIDVDIASSVDFLLSNSSLENAKVSAIKIRPSSVMAMISISGNQIAAQCQDHVIDIEGVQSVSIGPNVINSTQCNPTKCDISIRSVQNGGYVAKQTPYTYGSDAANYVADRRYRMQRLNSPTVEFEGVSGTGNF